MNSDALMMVQLAAVALLASALLVVWGDLGAFAFVRRMNGGVKFLLGLLAMAGMVGVMVAPNYVSGRRDAKGPPLDLDWSLMSLADGKEVNLSSLKGKLLFVNLWATWCGPCVKEMPSIETLYLKFAERDDVAFVLVSRDQTPGEAKDFAQKNGMKAPIYFAKGPPPRALQSTGIPLTVIVRKDGTEGHRHLGYRDWSGAATLIDDLAGSPTSDMNSPSTFQPTAKEAKR